MRRLRFSQQICLGLILCSVQTQGFAQTDAAITLPTAPATPTQLPNLLPPSTSATAVPETATTPAQSTTTAPATPTQLPNLLPPSSSAAAVPETSTAPAQSTTTAPATPTQLPNLLPPSTSATAVPETATTPAQSTTTAPSALATATPESSPIKNFSFGTFESSIFFNASEIASMKQAITSSEGRLSENQTVIEKVVPDSKPPTPLNDPAEYPVFSLSSILYRSPTNWTVWVGNKKITPTRNTTELKIVGLNANAATFSWTPSFAQAFMLRRANQQFVPVDAVKNRLVQPQLVQFDEATTTLTFTLRPNQSLVAGYLAVFEGQPESPKLPPLMVASEPGVKSSTEGSPGNNDLAREAIFRLYREGGQQLNQPPTANLPVAVTQPVIPAKP